VNVNGIIFRKTFGAASTRAYNQIPAIDAPFPGVHGSWQVTLQAKIL
jgi:hypothetical protein